MWTAPSSPADAPPLSAAAPVFAALGDPRRLHLLARLGGEGPLSISRLSEGAGISRQAVTKHLQVLEEAGLTTSLRRGREQLWQIEATRLAEARRSLELISQRWDEALERMKRALEEG